MWNSAALFFMLMFIENGENRADYGVDWKETNTKIISLVKRWQTPHYNERVWQEYRMNYGNCLSYRHNGNGIQGKAAVFRLKHETC